MNIKVPVKLSKAEASKYLKSLKPAIEDPKFRLSDYQGILKNDKALQKAYKAGHFN